MKKSEMLKALYDDVDEFLEQDLNRSNLVDFILEKCIERGMLPPKTILKPLNIVDNSWDPE